MKVKLNLKARMLLNILGLFLVIYVLALGYVGLRMNKISYSQATQLATSYSQTYANQIANDLNEKMGMSRTMGQALENYHTFPSGAKKKITYDILNKIAINNPEILATWVSLELEAIDTTWQQPNGRVRITYQNINQQLQFTEEYVDTSSNFTPSGIYYDALNSRQELLTNPYFFTYQDSQKEILETSIGVPIIIQDNAAGLAGFDIPLTHFQKLIEEIHPLEGSYAILVANDGQIVAHPDEKQLGESIELIEKNKGQQIIQHIQKGELLTYKNKDFNIGRGEDYYYAYSPIFIGKTGTPWAFGFAVPVSTIMAEAHSSLQKSLLVGIIGLLLIAFTVWFIARKITNPINDTTVVLESLANGEIDTTKELQHQANDETGKMANSANKLLAGLSQTVSFAREIGKGNLDVTYKKLSKNDQLGDALIEMQQSLHEAKNQEQARKAEEQKQNWITTGIAKFADILRQQNDDIAEFTYYILSNLVQYIDANQGGLYLINDDDPNDRFVELKASYAFERRKHLEMRIEIGEGLIGRCIQEQKVVYMTDLPEDYITITSGLGDAPPDALVIVPLKVNDEIHGAIELATFGKFEEHVIKFIETVGESIASTLSTTKINIRTSQLLEKSQQQSEEMAAQEEEMRQNMEELQATQEEAARRSAEMESLLNALNSSYLVIEYDLDGYILTVNENYLKLTGVSREQLIGTHHTANMEYTQDEKEVQNQFWQELRNGQSKKTTSEVFLNNNYYRFIETYTPILDENGVPEKILKIATDISHLTKEK